MFFGEFRMGVMDGMWPWAKYGIVGSVNAGDAVSI